MSPTTIHRVPFVLVLVLFAAGCCAASASAPPPATISVSNAAPAAPGQTTPTVWTGQYLCAQGATALRLTVQLDGTSARARFEFGPLPENPTVPVGSYTMRGTFRADTAELALVPDSWLSRPDGYDMVGLVGTMDIVRGTLVGTITYPTCGEVRLARAQ